MLNTKQIDFIEAVQSNRNVFLTGPPGTGKSYVIETLRKIVDVEVTATTGTAALLIHGKTIHSFLRLGMGNSSAKDIVRKMNGKKRKELKNVNRILIDEISMLSDQLLNLIDEVLQLIHGNEHVCGNVQMIFVGDFFQLPPVEGTYCFLSNVWNQLNFQIIILNENIRQSEDPDFFNFLSRARLGYSHFLPKDIELLNILKSNKLANNILPTILCPTRRQVDLINIEFYSRLPGPEIKYYVNIANNNRKNIEKIDDEVKRIGKLYNISPYLSLKKGTQVIITKNIDYDLGIVNGTRGTIITIMPTYVVLKLLNGNYYHLSFVTEKIEEIDCNEIHFTYLPVTYGWAITQHKSQGMTLEYIDITLSNVFKPGQAYVALSRSKNKDNIILNGGDFMSFRSDRHVIDFYNNFVN